MRYLQCLLGIILIFKGIKECIALPAGIAALHVGSAYTAGEAAGLVIGTLALLAGGLIFLVYSWRGFRGTAARAPG